MDKKSGSSSDEVVSDLNFYHRSKFDPINRIRWFMFYLCIFLSIFLFWNTASPVLSDYGRSLLAGDHKGPSTSDFNWNTSPVHHNLEYSPCYTSLGHFSCARLELPLDYWNGTTNETFSLAVIKKPAVVNITDPRYAGAVIVNPGGPGGSGVQFLVGAWRMLRRRLDSPTRKDPNGKYFDIISFDPRGVGFSTPNVHCFSNPGLDQGWQLRVMEEGILGSSDATFGRLWSMARARAGSCSLPLKEGKDIKPYVTTAHTARDMLELVEHHGQWRETEVKNILAKQKRRTSADVANLASAEPLKYRPGEEKILYSGGSYGTYLGLTFASMFPDRIHRLRVDGVVDADDYRQVKWTDNLADTEKEMHGFYGHCARAGYPACSLASTSGHPTVASVEARVKNITDSLKHNPLPVIGLNPEVITYSDAKHLIFAGLYSPIISFPRIANLLAGVEQGDGTLFAELLRPYHELSCPASPDERSNGNSATSLDKSTGVLAPDSTMAISCADGDDQSWMTKAQYSKYWHSLAKLSPTIGPMWAMFRMYCIHYSARPVYRFTAPFEANTSHPILLVGNTADPVTPLKNAFKMSKNYPGSVVLTQNSAGHTSNSVYSACTVGHVRRYFQTGELPEKGTVCEADETPFDGLDEEADANESNAEIREAFREGTAAMLASTRGLFGASVGRLHL